MQRVKGIGGSERHLLALLPELERRGIKTQMVVLRTGDGDRFVDAMRGVDVDTHAVRGGGHVQPELVPVLVSRIRHFRPDVVHIASPAAMGLQAARAARSLGIPTVAIYQTDLVGFAERYGVPGGARAMGALHPMRPFVASASSSPTIVRTRSLSSSSTSATVAPNRT